MHEPSYWSLEVNPPTSEISISPFKNLLANPDLSPSFLCCYSGFFCAVSSFNAMSSLSFIIHANAESCTLLGTFFLCNLSTASYALSRSLSWDLLPPDIELFIRAEALKFWSDLYRLHWDMSRKSKNESSRPSIVCMRSPLRNLSDCQVATTPAVIQFKLTFGFWLWGSLLWTD